MQGNIFHDLIKIFVTGCSLVSGLEPSSRGELRERLSLGLGLRHLDLTDVTRLDDLSLRLILQASGACMEFLYLRRCANITGGWRLQIHPVQFIQLTIEISAFLHFITHS